LHENFVKNLPKEIARGTLGDNATIGYTLVFDPNKTIDQHADTVKRLKRGEFTKEEIEQIKAAGFDPNIYITDKTQKISLLLYLLEADPSHDPLMRLVNAVVTIRGGETCHAAIFCRE
jgi:phosphoenolpyruvate synthase/pyruvate phosphate dikinase